MSDFENKDTLSALTLPAMTLRGLTVFPSMVAALCVGRAVSIRHLIRRWSWDLIFSWFRKRIYL